MRSQFIAATIAALSLVACSRSEMPAQRVGGGNVLIETPEYTGVIFSKDRASEFSFLFDEASTSYWEPSVDDISRAEECVRQFLVTAEDNPNLRDYQKDDAAFVLENLARYRRQYVGIEVDGEKRIWCNLFQFDDSTKDWRRDLVYVLDGGRDFWEIAYIPLKDECADFYVHGES